MAVPRILSYTKIFDDAPDYVKCKEKYRPTLYYLSNRQLPRETMMKILSYLDVISLVRCAQVCKEWNTLARHSPCWKAKGLKVHVDEAQDYRCKCQQKHDDDTGSLRFEIRRRSKSKTDESFNIPPKKQGKYLSKLYLAHCKYVTDWATNIIVNESRNLKTVALVGCDRITDRTCESLSRHCHQLRELDVSHSQVTDVSLRAISAGCPRLEYINVSGTQVTDQGLSQFSRRCPNITHVICWLQPLLGTYIEDFAVNCPQLKVLDIATKWPVEPEAITAVARLCPMLLKLCLGEGSASSLTDADLIALAEGCPGLRVLQLGSCENLTDDGLHFLMVTCPKLSSVHLKGCRQLTDNTLRGFAVHCRSLLDLSVSGSVRVTDEGLQELVGVTSHLLQTLQRLQVLNCKVTDEGLHHLASCSALRLLSIDFCRHITKEGIDNLKESIPDLYVHTCHPNLQCKV